MRKHLITILKIVVTVAGLGYVLLTVPIDDIGKAITDVQWGWLALAFVISTASLVLRAYRWLLLLRGLKVEVSFGRLVELYFVGNFFNAFLPSGFGGDAVRIMEVARDVPTNIAAGTVIVDRLTGLLMLFVMALLALPFRPSDFPQDLFWLVTAVSVIGIIGGIVLLEGSLIRRFGGWLPAKLSPVGDGPIAKLLQAVQGSGWRAILGALAVSTIFNLFLAGWWYIIGLSIGIKISYFYYLLVVPILSVALLVPSVSGLGVREYMAPLLFAGAGVEAGSAVAISLLVFLTLRLSSLLGAPVYILSTLRQRQKISVETAEVSAEETT
ncbi:MAG: lysylphosphatidylglycerol synthase transmembrane domain-containing protein [Candidatus Promineifilaceae bacterium]